MFSALNIGSTVYVLCKEEKKPKLYVAQVTERTEPTANMNAPQPMYGQPMPRIMKIVAKAGDTEFTFDNLDANAKFAVYSKENTTISTNREDMCAEWMRIVGYSRQIIDSVPYHQSVIDADNEIQSILNPQYAKEQERDKEIGELKKEMSDIKGGLTDIRTMLTEIAAGNVSGSRKTKEQ